MTDPSGHETPEELKARRDAEAWERWNAAQAKGAA